MLLIFTSPESVETAVFPITVFFMVTYADSVLILESVHEASVILISPERDFIFALSAMKSDIVI